MVETLVVDSSMDWLVVLSKLVVVAYNHLFNGIGHHLEFLPWRAVECCMAWVAWWRWSLGPVQLGIYMWNKLSRTRLLTLDQSTWQIYSALWIMFTQSWSSKNRFGYTSLHHRLWSIIQSPVWIMLWKVSWVIWHYPLSVVDQRTTRIESKPCKLKGSVQTLRLGYAL